MNKYINADEFVIPKGTVDDIAKRGVIAIHELLEIQPSADVIEVKPLCEKIKADLEEATESLTKYQYLSEKAKSFQKGRIFAHRFDLLQIGRLKRRETG